MKKTLLPIMAVSAAFTLCQAANAAVILSDDFDATADGPLTNDASWSAFSGADGSITVSSGVVTALGSGAEDVGTTIGSNLIDVYFGVTVNITTAASSDYVLGFRDGTSLAARFFLDDTGSGIRVGVNSGGTGGATAGNFSTATFGVGETIRLVGFADGNGFVSAWINPSAGDLASPDATFTNSDIGGFEEFYFRQGGSWDNGGADWTADNLIVATTFAEAIPEPSATLLGGLGVLVLLRRRNR